MKGLAPSGLYPIGSLANSSILYSTPIVKGFLHLGQIPFSFKLSLGLKLTPHNLCPS